MQDLKFIGIGGAYALGLGGNCAYYKDNKTLLLIDCCEDATNKLNNKSAFNGIEEVVVAITHTHADHVSGLGCLIWYCNFILNIRPKIIRNSYTFETHLTQLLTLLGVDPKFYEFVDSKSVVVDGCTIKMLPTTHAPSLECFEIMFEDKFGKYYYSGDTADFENIKKLNEDHTVKRIYCETSWKSYEVHIAFEDLKKIKSDKLTLMHFENEELYKLAQTEGFNVAKL